MGHNGVWELVELPEGYKPIGCKWVYKNKKDSKGNVKRFKAKLVTKRFTQRKEITYNAIFSPISSNDAFQVIMGLITHYDLELYQIDVKIAFLNGELSKEVHMVPPKEF